MMLRLRPILAFALALVLVLTAQSMAVARGAPAVAGAVTLCTGTGPVTVLTDADGQPVAPAHICPDCSLTLGTAPASAAVLIARPATLADALPAYDASIRPKHAPQPYSARDPPFAV